MIKVILLLVLLALLVLDMLQTITIVRPGPWREKNPAILWLIEQFESRGRTAVEAVLAWFGAWIFVTLLLAAVLWDFPAFYPLAVLALVRQAYTVRRNHRLGVRAATDL